MARTWKSYVKGLSPRQKERMLLVLLDHLLETPDAVDYRPGGKTGDPEEPVAKECIYWTGSGEDVLKR